MRTSLYSFGFAHHGRYSSVHRLLHYAKGCRTLDVTFPLRPYLSDTWNRRLELRWMRCIEWRLRPVFARRDRQCVHYIHPENSLFRGGDWKGSHGLVLTCHQPGTQLRQNRTITDYAGFFRGLAAADRVVLLASCLVKGYEGLCRPEQLRVILHGVDTEFFRPPARAPVEPLVLTVGNWLRDYDLWAEVVLRLASKIPHARFAVVALPAVVAAARARVAAVLGTRVRFLNGLSDEELRCIYHQASVLFLPLKDAGANNALLESMATGLPVVVSDLPATREYADDCGLYFGPDAVEEAVGQLAGVLVSASRRTDLGRQCRARAVGQLSWEAIAGRYQDLYSEVLESPASPTSR